jgi:hypothetical protein
VKTRYKRDAEGGTIPADQMEEARSPTSLPLRCFFVSSILILEDGHHELLGRALNEAVASMSTNLMVAVSVLLGTSSITTSTSVFSTSGNEHSKRHAQILQACKYTRKNSCMRTLQRISSSLSYKQHIIKYPRDISFKAQYDRNSELVTGLRI